MNKHDHKLKDIKKNNQSYFIHIIEKPGIRYKTQFIGSINNMNYLDEKNINKIGHILFETESNPAKYNFTGEEMYVRAKIVSDKIQDNPYSEGDLEMAWTQPVILK